MASLKLRKIIVEESENSDKKIAQLAQAQLEKMSQEFLEELKRLYPKTLAAFFDLASELIQGKWGEYLKQETKALSEGVFLAPFLFSLLALFKPFTKQDCPEIFTHWTVQKRQSVLKATLSKENLTRFFETFYRGKADPLFFEIFNRFYETLILDSLIRKGLIHYFRMFLESLCHPSSLLIERMLLKGAFKEALNMLLKIKNVKERQAAFHVSIHYFFKENQVEHLIVFLETRQDQKEQRQFIQDFLDQFFYYFKKELNQPHQNQALARVLDRLFALMKTWPLSEEKDMTIHRFVLELARCGWVEKALKEMGLIQKEEIRQLTISSLVFVLTSQKNFFLAKELIEAIYEKTDLEDAQAYLLKAFLALEDFSAALLYLDSIADQGAKKKASKLLNQAFFALDRQDLIAALKEREASWI